MESSRTTIGGNLLLEKSLYSKKVSSYNGSLQFLSGEAMKMASGKSAFILGKLSTCSRHQKTNSSILQFSNLKCCKMSLKSKNKAENVFLSNK